MASARAFRWSALPSRMPLVVVVTFDGAEHMATSLLDHLSQGHFNFLLADPHEIRQILPTPESRLPRPQQIFLQDETATPLTGFPILVNRALKTLEQAALDYLAAEEEAQIALVTRRAFDSKGFAAKWERYKNLLAHVTRNAAGMGFGNRYLDIFWLRHSQVLARALKDLPKSLLRRDLTLGRERGDELKYRVYFKWIDRVVHLTYDVVHELAETLGEAEETLFPPLLSWMRDNVLIFTEDLISTDLSELSSYFNGYLKTDGRDLRRRLQQLSTWHEQKLAGDATLRSAVENLLSANPDHDRAILLHRPGYLSFLSTHITYSETQLPTTQQIEIWEALLLKLKEFEVLHALRKMLVPVEVEESGALISRDRSVNMTWIGGPPVLRLSSVNRPLDFLSAWVVDPVVRRFGLVYDISEFSATLTLLGRAQKSALEDAFRQTFALQRKINQLAASLDLRLEKYLGDGAFYSGRKARQLLPAAIHLQRLYAAALEAGFPFDRGLRIAINFGEYRLLPLAGEDGERPRYEFFGHGLVELSRLSTGKKTQEIDELKNYLVGQGYPEPVVTKFFAPMLRKSNGDLVDKDAQSRRFYAYINPNGTLINEGIVATESYVKHLGTFPELSYAKLGGRGHVVVTLEDENGEALEVGLRKLGMGKFKGLETMPIYEVVDLEAWPDATTKQIPAQNLRSALERVFASALSNQ